MKWRMSMRWRVTKMVDNHEKVDDYEMEKTMRRWINEMVGDQDGG